MGSRCDRVVDVKNKDEECEGLKAKCEAAMTDFDNNPAVVALRKKISTLSSEAKEHKANLDRVAVLLDLKRDRMEVVSKVVPYIVMELVHNDELGRLVGKLVSSTVFYDRCVAVEEKATPFFAPVSKPISPPDDVSSAKLQSPPA
uniref:Uncharacterized protein n=1 Tax=Tanacetum cinerariifolium TaxID=118510 RepID=A0A699KXX3_TANCI|nr:hypothetical protein [Tanacetum cinerariifolium]